MVGAARQVGEGRPTGLWPVVLILGLLLLSLVGLGRAGLTSGGGLGSLVGLGPYLARITAGAAVQAGLSTALSLTLGTALALALVRRPDRAPRRLLLVAMSVAAAAPAVVVVFGLVALHGRGGLSGMVAQAIGLSRPPAIYGLGGILLAHVALNAPFVARVLVAALERQPGERLRLAQSLGFGPAAMLRHLDGPVLRRELPPLATLVFLVCFTSFAVVLTLGGGPSNSTLEVAIYEALRVEADFARAAALSLLQLALGLGLVLAMGTWARRPAEAAESGQRLPRPDAGVPWLRAWDGGVLVLALLLVLGPALATLSALPALPSLLEREVLQALVSSLLVAVSAALICVTLAIWLAFGTRRPAVGQSPVLLTRATDATALALLGLPPFAFVTGLYVWLRGAGDTATIGFLLLPLVNALVALPFAYRFVQPPLALAAERHGRLAASLGLSGLDRLRVLEWPALRRPALAALALAAAFSMGDFGVVALFGSGDLVTLPALLAARLGAYRMEEAGAVALLILALVATLAFIADRLGRGEGGW